MSTSLLEEHTCSIFRTEGQAELAAFFLLEILLDFYETTWRCIPSHSHHCENLKWSKCRDYFICFRQLPSLMNLVTLHMRDTQRTLNNIPGSMDSLTNLTELDLAQNALPKVPEALYSLRNLCRLNISDNEITELSQAIGKCYSYRDLLNLDLLERIMCLVCLQWKV